MGGGAARTAQPVSCKGGRKALAKLPANRYAGDMQRSLQQQLCVVLVEPREPGNIGMVCRAMANFGVRDLRLVNPCDHLAAEALKFAVGGRELLDDAVLFADLQAALADVHCSFAATRRVGRLRGALHPSCELPGLVDQFPPQSRIALVFGREDRGLTGEELAACSAGVRIFSSEEVGSLNLSQAVLALLYELHRQPAAGALIEKELPEMAELEQLHLQMEEVLERIAFNNPACPGATAYRLRQLFNRALPDRDEVGLLRGMWGKLAESVNNWPGRRRGAGPK